MEQIRKIGINDKLYPENLRNIKNPPEQLYFKGNISLLNELGIAVVGTRYHTIYGKRMAEKFSKELSKYGLTIISGMAKGIDSIAHKSSLEVQGNTIAVLPCGLNNIYPKENIGLFKRILENGGLIITEYEKEVEADSEKFLQRNRIVSALSIGVLVIEGGYRSGTGVTAKIAQEQGKKLFCVPSNLESRQGITPNRLIQKGAILVTEAEDIVKQYENMKFEKHIIEEVQEIEDDENKEILMFLNTTKHINEISRKLKLSINQTSVKLMMLELEGKIVALPGDYYKRRKI